MSRTRIKICGITNTDDLHYATELGVDAIGLVFVAKSPRCITIDAAASLLLGKPPFLSIVALFMNPELSSVKSVIESVPIDCLQFHGSESADFCNMFQLPYIKAVAMGSSINPSIHIQAYIDTASAMLLDAHCVGESGGTGTIFNWTKAEGVTRLPIVLAGGLTADNVGDAITNVKPYAVDVSSSIELSRGVKDKQLMHQFVKAVKSADEGVKK